MQYQIDPLQHPLSSPPPPPPNPNVGPPQVPAANCHSLPPPTGTSPEEIGHCISTVMMNIFTNGQALQATIKDIHAQVQVGARLSFPLHARLTLSVLHLNR